MIITELFEKAFWKGMVKDIMRGKKLFPVVILLAVTILSATGCDGKTVVEKIDTEAQAPYTFVWMSDTQVYSESLPEVYKAMTMWIAENADRKNIKFVFHTGDVVNQSDDAKQWQNADMAMGYLDKTVPYSILAGNHDLTDSGDPYGQFLEYFGKSRFAGRDVMWYFRDGEASAQIIDTGSRKYLALALGFQPKEEVIDWANGILKEYQELPAILTTHDYLNVDGTRSDTGNRLFDEIVRKNPNVYLVLCGHNHEVSYCRDELDDDGDGRMDRTVDQLLADYQETPNGGNGFMRLLTIDEKKKELEVSAYSPYLDQYNYFSETEYPGKDHFKIDISDWF